MRFRRLEGNHTRRMIKRNVWPSMTRYSVSLDTQGIARTCAAGAMRLMHGCYARVVN